MAERKMSDLGIPASFTYLLSTGKKKVEDRMAPKKCGPGETVIKSHPSPFLRYIIFSHILVRVSDISATSQLAHMLPINNDLTVHLITLIKLSIHQSRSD